jgi:hypothetical protein
MSEATAHSRCEPRVRSVRLRTQRCQGRSWVTVHVQPSKRHPDPFNRGAWWHGRSAAGSSHDAAPSEQVVAHVSQPARISRTRATGILSVFTLEESNGTGKEEARRQENPVCQTGPQDRKRP